MYYNMDLGRDLEQLLLARYVPLVCLQQERSHLN